MDKLISKIDTSIRWSFYIVFFFVPIVMWPRTFELFEFNKMWLVFGFSVFIFFLWVSKMVVRGKIEIRKTPLDIPLALFLISQIISTIFSMDPHTSLWGYYSRFNGGLLSTIAYILLYYAYATNLIPEDPENTKPVSYKMLLASVFSGIFVTLWGLPSHYGYDPTCLMFRGTLDVSCWTDQFQPTVRIFSTLGQPNWLGTFLAALIPLTIGMGVVKLIEKPKKFAMPILYLVISFLFLVSVLYTRSQSSVLGLAAGIAVFLVIIFIKYYQESKRTAKENPLIKYLAITILIFGLTAASIGTSIGTIDRFVTFSGIMSRIQKTEQKAPQKATEPAQQGIEGTSNILLAGSQSGDIRLIVWKGAIEIFKQHPLFGTGVETYAYAYYQVKPKEHNLTSEWDYLYNKAHNEYLNYLATTGAFGLGTYLLIIAFFFYYAVKLLFKNDSKYTPLGAGIIGGYIAILISNFFGFSVVPINLLMFMFPILFFELIDPTTLSKSFAFPSGNSDRGKVGMAGMTVIVLVAFLSIYMEFYLLNFWFADINYALGNNLDKAGEFTQAYKPLTDAVSMLPGEDLYKDELSVNKATLAVLLAQNNHPTEATQFGREAQALSDEVISRHPNNVVYYKTRIRVQYALGQLNPKFIDEAIATANEARKLAPTDAKLAYNLALFYSQKGDQEKMLEMLNVTTDLKPNYVDALYSKALLYIDLAKKNPEKATDYKAKAKEALEYLLRDGDPNNKGAKDLLKTL